MSCSLSGTCSLISLNPLLRTWLLFLYIFVFFALLQMYFIFSHGQRLVLHMLVLCQAVSIYTSTITHKLKPTVRLANRQLVTTLVTGHICRAKTSWPQQG